MRNTEYPEIIRRFRPKGTCLKKAGDIYNVYQVTSKRVPGKKNPIPQVGALLGYIDEQGFHEKKKQMLDTEDLVSYEYGYTAFLLLHEDDFVSAFRKSHPKILAREAKEVFRNVILVLSPYSVLNADCSFERRTAEELHDMYGASVSAVAFLINRIMPLDETVETGLRCMGCIKSGKKIILARPCDALRAHLDDVGIQLEGLMNVRNRISS